MFSQQVLAGSERCCSSTGLGCVGGAHKWALGIPVRGSKAGGGVGRLSYVLVTDVCSFCADKSCALAPKPA